MCWNDIPIIWGPRNHSSSPLNFPISTFLFQPNSKHWNSSFNQIRKVVFDSRPNQLKRHCWPKKTLKRHSLLQRKIRSFLTFSSKIADWSQPINHSVPLISYRIQTSQKAQLGNLTSRCSRSHQRQSHSPPQSAMANISSASYLPPSLNFSVDSPPALALTPDQYNYCREAVRVLKERIRTPDRILQEFANVQVCILGAVTC